MDTKLCSSISGGWGLFQPFFVGKLVMGLAPGWIPIKISETHQILDCSTNENIHENIIFSEKFMNGPDELRNTFERKTNFIEY